MAEALDLRSALRQATGLLVAAGIAAPQHDAEVLLSYCLDISRSELKRQVILGDFNFDENAASKYADLIAQRAAHVPLQHLTGIAHFRNLGLLVGPGVFIPRPETELVTGTAIAEVERICLTVGGNGWLRQAGGNGWLRQVGGSQAGLETTSREQNIGWLRQAGGSQAGLETTAVAPDNPKRPIVVDLCTGSGAIAIAIATETNAEVHAVELDKTAYNWAAKNIEHNTKTNEITLYRGDARRPPKQLHGKADIVVSNPPYIPPGAIPEDKEVREYDPAVALYGLGKDGLEVPTGIIQAAAQLLRSGGLLIMEHGEEQGQAIREIANRIPDPDNGDAHAFTDIQTHQDLTNRDRYLTARRTSECLVCPTARV